MDHKYILRFILIIFMLSAILSIAYEYNSRIADSPTITDETIINVTTSVCLNPESLKHIYNPKRLIILDQCKTVSGTITKVIRERDGDTHIRLKVDAEYSGMINQANVKGQGGNLVVEIVCAYKVVQPNAISACTGYENKIAIPKMNEYVTITGQFVSDIEHGGWNEIHPVYEINIR